MKSTTRRPLYRSLYFQVIVAIIIGVLLGHFLPETGVAMKPFGDAFIKLIKMIIAPIIFCTVVVGIAGMEDMKKVGKTGGYALLYFEIVSSIALLIVLGTSSSESVLPRMMAKMENLGVQKSTVGLVIPTGYSFNLDGTSIYLTMAAMFVAQATNTPMTLTQQLTLLAVLLLTSKGAAGVTGSGFIVLAATLSAVGNVPVAGLALILGIDRFMSEARALTNLIGNGVATVVVGKWCKELDVARMKRVLNRETEADAEEPEKVIGAIDQHMPVKAG